METSQDSEEQKIMILPKNPKKYVGHIRSFQNRYTFEYISKDTKIKELFYHKDIGSKESAFEAASLFQKKWCQNHHFITNLYYIVNQEYLLVELNHHQHMKVDFEDRSFIENYNWRIQNHSSYPTTFIYEEKDGEKKRTFISFQQMKYHTQKIHFKNSNRLDFRKSNIILLSA
jgi:hypothetical protein